MSRYAKQVIIARNDIKLPKGKFGAQASHASKGAIKSLMVQKGDDWVLTVPPGSALDAWWNGPWTKVVVRVDSEHEIRELEHKAKRAGLPVCVVTDAGHTIYHGVPTVTCMAIGPRGLMSWTR